jgi:hypothetical protein
MSFVLDAGSSMHFYLSLKAKALLKTYGLIVMDKTDMERLTN